MSHTKLATSFYVYRNMRSWRDKLMEQIEPSTTYTREDTCALADAPDPWLESIDFPVKGRALLMALLEYMPVRGRVRQSPLKKRTTRIHIRLSKQQKEFLDELARCYRMDICTILRSCCFGQPVCQTNVINMEAEVQISYIESHLVFHKARTNIAICGFGELQELLAVFRGKLSATYVIEFPTNTTPKQFRFTIRFTRDEIHALKQHGSFAKHIWQKICDRTWTGNQPISEETYASLEAAQRSLSAAESHEAKQVQPEVEELVKFLRGVIGGSSDR